MSFWTWITGYNDDADTYAANVVAQWRILNSTFSNPPSPEWLNFHAVFVANYGPPAKTESEMRERAVNAYKHGIDNALTDGFMDGIKTFPATLGNAVTGVAGGFLAEIPGWVKWTAVGVGGLVALGYAGHVVKTIKSLVK